MAPLGRTIMVGVAAFLMLVVIAPGAQGQGNLSVGGEFRGVTVFRGKLLCVDCTLQEMRGTLPGRPKLLELRHRAGQVVVQMTWINEGSVWTYFLRPRAWVRGKTSLFQQLMAEENMFEEVEITGIVTKGRTLDMSKVEISPLSVPLGGVRFHPPSFFWE